MHKLYTRYLEKRNLLLVPTQHYYGIYRNRKIHKEHFWSNTCKIYVKYKLMSCSHTQECHWKGYLYNFQQQLWNILKDANHTISSLSKIKCSMMLVIWERSVKKKTFKSSKILINQPREHISEEQIMLHAHNMEFISQKLFASWVFHTWYGDILQFHNYITENVFY